MSFAEDVAAANSRRSSQCTVGVWRGEFGKSNPKEAAEFDQALEDPTVNGSAIHAAMKLRGFKEGANTVTRHRRGGCSCPSPTT